MSFSPVLSSRKRSLAEMVIEVGEFSLLISFPPLVSLFCVKINVFIDRLSFCQSAVSLLLRNRCFSATLLTLILSSTTEHFSQFSWPHWHLKINSLRNKMFSKSLRKSLKIWKIVLITPKIENFKLVLIKSGKKPHVEFHSS